MDYKVFNTFLDPIIVLNEDFEIVYCNLAISLMSGISIRRFKVGKDFSKIISFEENLLDGKIGDITEPTQYKTLSFVSKKGETKYLMSTFQPCPSGTKHWILYLKDVSLEMELQNKYAAARKGKESAEAESRVDALTGIPNRRAFNEKIEHLFSSSARKHFNFCAMVFDIDNFKNINDTYGHGVGDIILQDLAKLVAESALRENDFLARVGGEEFVILLTRVHLKEAKIVAERVRSCVEKYPFTDGKVQINVTISVGLAQIDESMISADQLFDAADKASYQSKALGKNMVSIYKPESDVKKGVA